MREDIHYFLPPAWELPFVVEMCGISYCDGSYRQQRRASPVCVVEYIVRGTGTVIVDGVSYTAGAGDVYILPLGSNHTYYSDPADPWEKLFINAGGAVIPPLLTAYGLDGQVVFPRCPLEGLFRDLFVLSGSREADGGLPPEQRMEQCALKFHEILMGIAATRQKDSALPPEAIRLKNLIDSRLDHSFTIRELARSAYRSEDYVIKLFRRCFGQTPHAYSLSRKVLAAQRLLSGTRMPVAVIAASLGFDDPQYFSHVFRRAVGTSPTGYRRQV